MTVLTFQGCHNKIWQTGWLKQQKVIFSQFWKLEVQGQDADHFCSPASSTLGWQFTTTRAVCLTSSLWLYISGALSSSYKDARPFGLIVPSLHFYLTLILSIKILSLKIITLWFGGSTYECLFVWGLGTGFFFFFFLIVPPTRNWTQVTAVQALSLNHWTPKELP